jgi:protein-S-isoprenylcysteine O-methyltransferase Ste14
MSFLASYLLSLSLLIGISLLVLRLFVLRDYLRRGRLSVPSAVLQVVIFLGFGYFPSIYLPNTWLVSQVAPPLRFIGLASLSIGLIVILTGIYQLGLLRSVGLQTGALKDSSQYRFTRNPQVLGCVSYVTGFLILWPSWFALGWGLTLVIILHVMVVTEEQHLQNAHGQVYEQYCKRVPRYLGYPHKS